MNLLLTMFHGPTGKVSAMRGMSIMIVVAIMGVWAYVSVRKLEMQTFDETTVAIMAIAFTGKFLQKGKETAP